MVARRARFPQHPSGHGPRCQRNRPPTTILRSVKKSPPAQPAPLRRTVSVQPTTSASASRAKCATPKPASTSSTPDISVQTRDIMAHGTCAMAADPALADVALQSVPQRKLKHAHRPRTNMAKDHRGRAGRHYGMVLSHSNTEVYKADPIGCSNDWVHGRILLGVRQVTAGNMLFLNANTAQYETGIAKRAATVG